MANEPTAPDSLPNYLADGLPKQDNDTLQDVINYAEELINHRAEAEPEIPETADVVEEESSKGGSIVLEKVKCNKDSCHCNDGELHGPYKYRYWSESGQTQKEYVGKPD